MPHGCLTRHEGFMTRAWPDSGCCSMSMRAQHLAGPFGFGEGAGSHIRKSRELARGGVKGSLGHHNQPPPLLHSPLGRMNAINFLKPGRIGEKETDLSGRPSRTSTSIMPHKITTHLSILVVPKPFMRVLRISSLKIVGMSISSYTLADQMLNFA